MITTPDLLQAGFLEHPFIHYQDTRFFDPNLNEQRKVFEVVHSFLCDQKDPYKNLGVVAGPVGSGKSMLAMKLAQTHFLLENRGTMFGLYLNTNTLTEPRHFLMAVIETLGIQSARSNANRIENIYERLEQSTDQLLLVLDGPPVDQEYLTQLLDWSVEHQKKIRTIIFLQDLNNTVSNIGSLSQFLGLYVPFRSPSIQEIASLLYARCRMAGLAEPLSVLPESKAIEIAENAHGSLTEALFLASDYLSTVLEERKTKLTIPNLISRI